MLAATDRYTAVAIVLHWAIAAALIGNGLLGWWMGAAIEDVDTQRRAIAAFQLHKSLGLTILTLSLLRLAWRLAHRPPAPPARMPRWERWAGGAAHWAFYFLLLAIPLTGWILVSAQWREGAPLNVPTIWFGWFEVPHLFGLDQASGETREAVSRQAAGAHRLLAWAAAGLLVLHVTAALRHHFLLRDAVLERMLPRWSAGEPARAAVLLGGLGLIGLAAAAIVVALLREPLGSVAFALIEGPEGATGAAAEPRAGTWNFSPDHGSVLFRGVHAGATFNGEFTRWRARLRFDPDDLPGSVLTAEIETGSATDDIPLHDQTLPEAEWFDVARHPTADFRSTQIAPAGNGRFAIDGVLVIKGRELPVSLELRFDSLGVAVTGRFKVDRAAANLGMESDPEAEYVSREIDVTVRAAGLK